MFAYEKLKSNYEVSKKPKSHILPPKRHLMKITEKLSQIQNATAVQLPHQQTQATFWTFCDSCSAGLLFSLRAVEKAQKVAPVSGIAMTKYIHQFVEISSLPDLPLSKSKLKIPILKRVYKEWKKQD